MKKRCGVLISLMLVLVLSLAGCAKGLDGTQTAAVMDEKNIPLAEINMLLRYQQAQMESAYSGFMGENVFQQDLTGTGVPYGETVRDGMAEEFQQMYVLEAEAAGLGISLSEEEKTAIAEAAKKFMDDNTGKKVRNMMTASQETAEHLLQLMTIREKMRAELTKDVDTNVSDEEAAQKKVTYLFISKESTETDADGKAIALTDEELKKAKEDAQAVLDKARESGDLSAAAEEMEKATNTQTYGADSALFPEDIMKAANALKEGEFSEVLEGEQAFYVIHMDSLLDREATDSKKRTIISQREQELFEQKYEELKEKHTFEAKEDVLKQITFEQPVKLKAEEEQQQ